MSQRNAGRKKESRAGIPEDGREVWEVDAEEEEDEDRGREAAETNAGAGKERVDDEPGEVLNDGVVGVRVRVAGGVALTRKGTRTESDGFCDEPTPLALENTEAVLVVADEDGGVAAVMAGDGGSVSKKWAGMDSVSWPRSISAAATFGAFDT